MVWSPMTLRALSLRVINISLIRRMNHRCMKWCDLNVTHQSCVYPRQDSTAGVPRQGWAGPRCFFSVPQHQNSLLEHVHTRRRQLWDIGCEHTHYLLRVVTDWVTPQLRVWFTRFRSKMEDRGRNKCWDSLRKEANAATLSCHYETRGSHPPVPSVHSGLGEIEEHYLFIFILLSSSQLIPQPSAFALLIATYFPLFI